MLKSIVSDATCSASSLVKSRMVLMMSCRQLDQEQEELTKIALGSTRSLRSGHGWIFGGRADARLYKLSSSLRRNVARGIVQAEKGRDLDVALFGDNLAMPIFASAVSHHPIVAHDYLQAANLQNSTAGFAFRRSQRPSVRVQRGDVRAAPLVFRYVFPEPLLPAPVIGLRGPGFYA